jgi:hypothetical protein
MKALAAIALMIGSLFVLGMQGEATRSKLELTAAEQDDIREAVFRYQFEHNASGQRQNATFYFLSYGKDKEPGDDFIVRFKDHKPPVKKRSQSSKVEGEVIDKETGERGLIFSAVTIKVIDANKVQVDGGYYEGGLSSSGNVYTLERKEGKWIVTKDQMLWIS